MHNGRKKQSRYIKGLLLRSLHKSYVPGRMAWQGAQASVGDADGDEEDCLREYFARG